MTDKLYFPVDENFNLFCLSSSSTGLVIPLGPFGYPSTHLTIYMRDVVSKEGFQKLVIHITHELTGEKIIESYVEFNKEMTKRYFEEKFHKYLLEIVEIMKECVVKEEVLRSKKLHCYDCMLSKFGSLNLSTRKAAAKSFIAFKEKIPLAQLSPIFPCSNPDHHLLIDMKSGDMFMKTRFGVTIYKDKSDHIFKKIEAAIQKIFPEEIAWMDKIHSEFSIALEPYKIDSSSGYEKTKNAA